MVENEQFGNQRTDCLRQRRLHTLDELLTSLISSIETAKKENLREISGYRAAAYASAFLGKKYMASGQAVPSRSQLESYVTEFHHGLYFVMLHEIIDKAQFRFLLKRPKGVLYIPVFWFGFCKW